MLGLLFLSICALSATSDGNTRIFHVEQTPAEKDVSFCIRHIITDITEKIDFVMDVSLINMEELVEIHKLHGIRRVRYVTRTFSWIQSTLHNRIYVISVTDIEEFKNGMNQAMGDHNFYNWANFIIVMKHFKDYHHSEMVKFLDLNNIYNVTILARDDGSSDYQIYGYHSPIKPCSLRKKLAVVSNCTKYREGPRIFPKILSIRGCRFRFITYNFFPLINLDDPREDGIEQRMMKHFQKHAGVKIQLLPYSKINKLGRIVGNFTYVDVLLPVLKNTAEGALGGHFITFDGAGRYSFGYPLTIDHIVVIVRRADFLGPWHAVLCKLTIGLILVFALVIIFSILACYLPLYPKQRADPVRDTLIVYGYFLNKTTVNKFNPGIPESFISGSLLFSVFILPYIVQAYMSSSMTSPIRGPEPKTLDEVLEQSSIVVTSEWEQEELAKNRTDCESRLDCLKVVRDQKGQEYYTLDADELYNTYKWMLADKQCNLLLYNLKEPVTTVMRTIYFRRGSVLVRPYNDFLLKLMSSGLIDVHFREIEFKERLKCRPQHFSTAVPLSLSRNFRVAFTLLFAGICVSAVIFAYEVLNKRG